MRSSKIRFQHLRPGSLAITLCILMLVGCKTHEVTLTKVTEPDKAPLIIRITSKTDSGGSTTIDLYPKFIYVRVGDTVRFDADETSLVCVSHSEVFGGDRFVVKKGESLTVLVRSDVDVPIDEQKDFRFRARAYPSTSQCPSGGDEGGGKVGGGG